MTVVQSPTRSARGKKTNSCHANPARWSVRRLLAVLLLAGAAGLAPTAAAAQPLPLPDKTYMNRNVIVLPIWIDNRMRQELSEIQLFVKDDPHQAWKLAERAVPYQKEFTYRAPRDGEYWFTVVTVNRRGQPSVTNLDNLPPQRIVVIDREQPQLEIRALPATADGQQVECRVLDPNADPASVTFEYQTADRIWRMLSPMKDKADTYNIPRQAVFTGMLRVSAADRCGNKVSREMHIHECMGALRVANSQGAHQAPPLPPDTPQRITDKALSPTNFKTPGGDDGGEALVPVSKLPELPPVLPPTAEEKKSPKQLPTMPEASLPPKVSSPSPVAAPQAGKAAAYQHVRNLRLILNYQIEKQGEAGIGKVEIWMTLDQGKTWHRLAEDPDKQTPAEIMLPGEGTYGLKLVASNAYGYGGAPPVAGDAPDWLVEVDRVPPEGRLLSIQPIKGSQPGLMFIRWTATDKNLADEPIELSYASRPDGPWTSFARSLKNTGYYSWQAPRDLRGDIFIRMVVTDKAGNTTEVRSEQPIRMDDGTRPVVRIQTIEQASGRLPRSDE